MLFRCGHHPFLEVGRLQFGASFLSVQKATLPQAKGTLRPSLACCFGVATWAFFGGRTATIWSELLSVQKATLGTGRLQFGTGFLSVEKTTLGRSPPHWHDSVWWTRLSWQSDGYTICSEVLVVSESNVRPAASQRHHPAFTGMQFRCGHSSLVRA